LDAIVLMSMSKEASRRYGSAGDLADDLARFQARRPVVAREPSIGYLVAAIAPRHPAAVIATTVSVLALVMALAVSLWQARVAVTERNRAAARFDETRAMASALIFQIHDAVRPLAGSTPARRLIVSNALTYLERLSREAEADESLRLELARAYHRIGA